MSKPFTPTFSYVRIMRDNTITAAPLVTRGLYTYQWTEKVQKTEKKLKDLQSKIGHGSYNWCIVEKVISRVGLYKVTPPQPPTQTHGLPPLSYKQFKWDFEKDRWTQMLHGWLKDSTVTDPGIKGVDANVWQDRDTAYVVVFPSPETIEWLNKVAADVPREF